jgi:hypothetical protein
MTVKGLKVEKFEKLDPFPILVLRRNFLKGVKRSAAAEQAFTGSRTSGEVLDGSGFVPEPPHSLGFRVYVLRSHSVAAQTLLSYRFFGS